MSEAELIRAFAEAWNGRDVAAIRELAHESVEYVNPPAAIEPGTRYGRDGLVKVAETQWEILDTMDILRVEQQGSSLVAILSITATIPGSDSQLENEAVSRWSFQDGLLARIEILGAGSSFREGLRAAGLEGSPDPTEERQDGQGTT